MAIIKYTIFKKLALNIIRILQYQSIAERMDSPGNIVMGVSVGLALWGFYRYTFNQTRSIFKQQPEQVQARYQQGASNSVRQEEAMLFKRRLSQKISKLKITNSSSLQECKQATYLIFSFALTNIILKNLELQKRRKLLKRTSPAEWSHYLQLLIQGQKQSRCIGYESKKEAYSLMGINGQVFIKYDEEMIAFKKSLRNEGMTFIPCIRTLTLPETRQILNLQTIYLKHNTKKLVQQINKSTKSWSEEEKQHILKVLSLIIIDESLSKTFPEVDEIQIEVAKKNFAQQLEGELQELGKLQEKFYTVLARKIRNTL